MLVEVLEVVMVFPRKRRRRNVAGKIISDKCSTNAVLLLLLLGRARLLRGFRCERKEDFDLNKVKKALNLKCDEIRVCVIDSY